VLEPLRRDHEAGLRAAAADERIWHFMVTDDPDAWLRATFAEAEAGIRVPFTAITDREAVGSTSYMSLAPEHLRLEIGSTWMHPSTWGTGANVEAKYLLLRHESSSRPTRGTSGRGPPSRRSRRASKAFTASTCSCATASAATPPGTA